MNKYEVLNAELQRLHFLVKQLIEVDGNPEIVFDEIKQINDVLRKQVENESN